MKNTFRVLVIFTVTAALILAGCASMKLVGIDSESVAGPRQVRQFGTIDPKDITIYGFYKDESRKQISVNQRDISFDNSRVGSQTVTVNISGGFQASFQVEVMELTGIEVVSQPPALKLGMADNKWPGLEIQGEWNQMGSDKINIAECEFTGFDANRAGSQTVTAAWKGHQTTFNVEVVAMASLTITSPPAKTTYNQGDTLELTGLKVTGAWPRIGEEEIPITPADITGFSSDTLGSKTLTITKNGRTASFTVTVASLPKYIITGSGTAFTATNRGATVGAAGQPIQAVIDAIKADIGNNDWEIQFGDGTTSLNTGTATITFDGASGAWPRGVTLTGKLTSAYTASSSRQATIIMINGVSVTSKADIANTSGLTGGRTIDHNSTGSLTITGGTVSAGGSTVENQSTGSVIIAGGTVSTSGGTAVSNNSNSTGSITISGGTVSAGNGAIGVVSRGNLTISGGTVRSTTNTGVSVSGGTAVISGGTISATTSRALQISNAKVTVSGSVEITSASTIATIGTIYFYSLGELEMTGGTVRNTAAVAEANAIFTSDTRSKVNITGGTVSTAATPGNYAVNNTVAANAANIVVRRASVAPGNNCNNVTFQ